MRYLPHSLISTLRLNSQIEKKVRNMKTFIVALIALVVIAGSIWVYVWTGSYNISAASPHWSITLEMLETVRDRSIVAHSKGISTPPLAAETERAEKGLHHYHPMCRLCHGAPGYEREEFAMGLYPGAPDLASGQIQQEWNDAELYWIVKNGLKMTGMPSFGVTHDDEDIWGLVAFVRRLAGVQPAQYRALVEKTGLEKETERSHEKEADHH